MELTPEEKEKWGLAVLFVILFIAEDASLWRGFLVASALIYVFFRSRHSVIIISLATDIVDWLGPGMFPIAGDVVDIFAVIFQLIKLGASGLVGRLELIPFVDIVPIFTLNAVLNRDKAQQQH